MMLNRQEHLEMRFNQTIELAAEQRELIDRLVGIAEKQNGEIVAQGEMIRELLDRVDALEAKDEG